jgi:hypothetical protein
MLFAAGMRAKSRGVPFVAQVPHGQFLQREAKVQFGLKMAVMDHSRPHARPHERNAIPFLQWQICGGIQQVAKQTGKEQQGMAGWTIGKVSFDHV